MKVPDAGLAPLIALVKEKELHPIYLVSLLVERKKGTIPQTRVFCPSRLILQEINTPTNYAKGKVDR